MEQEDEMTSGYFDNISLFDNITMFDNSSSLCATRHIQQQQGLPFSPAASIAIRSIQFTYYFVLVVLGIFFNLFVVILVAKSKKLQTMSFAIALQVVILDLFWGSMVVFPALINVVAGKWILGSYFCILNGFLVFTVVSIRRTLMMVLVIDRFLLVFKTFTYPKHHFKAVLCLSIFSWIGCSAISIIALPGILDCYSLSSQIWLCYTSLKCSKNCSTFSYAYYGMMGVPICVLPLFLYGILYLKARKVWKNDTIGTFHKSEWRATVTFFLLFITLFVITVPTIGGLIIIRSMALDTSAYAMLGITILSNGPSLLLVLDPIVIMRNRDVREAISGHRTLLSQKRLMKIKQSSTSCH